MNINAENYFEKFDNYGIVNFINTKNIKEVPKELLALAEKTYLENVHTEFSTLDELDSKAKITDVYVLLQEREGIPQSDLVDEKRKNKDQEKDNIEQKTEKPPQELEEVLKNNDKFILAGEPGGGKSTTLKYITSFLCSKKIEVNEIYDKNIGISDYIPIFIELGKVNEFDVKNEYIIIIEAVISKISSTIIQEIIKQKVLDNLVIREDVKEDKILKNIVHNLSFNLILSWIQSNKLFLLLDGFDEVPISKSEKAKKVVNSLVDIVPKAIVAVRIANLRSGEKPNLAKEFTILPLNPTSQEEFIKKWILQFDENKDKVIAQDILSIMQEKPSLIKATETPLLLKIAVRLACEEGLKIFEQASSRSKLYDEHFKYLFYAALRRNGIQIQKNRNIYYDNEFENIKHILKTIALEVYQKGECKWTEISSKCKNTLNQLNEYLRKENIDKKGIDFLRRDLGILASDKKEKQEYENANIFFLHQTFLEFYFGASLKNAWLNNTKQVEKWLKVNLHQLTYREPILLMAGLFEETELKNLDLFITTVKKQKSPFERTLKRDLLLAGRIIAESNASFERYKNDMSKIVSLLSFWYKPIHPEVIEVLASFARKDKFQKDLSGKFINLFGKEWLASESTLQNVVKIFTIARHKDDKVLRSAKAMLYKIYKYERQYSHGTLISDILNYFVSINYYEDNNINALILEEPEINYKEFHSIINFFYNFQKVDKENLSKLLILSCNNFLCQTFNENNSWYELPSFLMFLVVEIKLDDSENEISFVRKLSEVVLNIPNDKCHFSIFLSYEYFRSINYYTEKLLDFALKQTYRPLDLYRLEKITDLTHGLVYYFTVLDMC
ncbi:NACHT domain-containing protein [Bernardetia sp. OM2101]|uniref:NACHT domain-containing protein n=1 Tax=Bernardetia sp. OM2101 TaxID=3344876 RepID=UPI0035CEB86D